MKIIVDHNFSSISTALTDTNYNIVHNRSDTLTQIRGVRQYGNDIYLTPVEGELILISPTDEISYVTNE
jgi:hypothetical protein